MKNANFNIHNNKIILQFNENIYSLKAIMKASYIYIDNFYIYFDYESKNIIKAIFKSKKNITRENLEKYVGEFMNELLYQNIRIQISKDTCDLRKIILSRALYGTTLNINKLKDKEYKSNTNSTNMNLEESSSYLKDKENIASSWFEKN
ncbi:His-Xaa-Ser system protein HxsD (plasmid) [Haloimpatiens sp. FM7330]|uniref:His-Xaa-Ser system protein HxsD n=1 Tax=Haloimpatiens sp. FM7330 TaxID=3298610 RepID=UPI003633A825